MATLRLRKPAFKSRKQREEELILAAKVKRIHRLYDEGYTIKDIIGNRALLSSHFPDSKIPRASQSLRPLNTGLAGRAESHGVGTMDEGPTKTYVSLADVPKPVTYAMSLAHISGKGQEINPKRKQSLWKMCFSKTVSRNNGIVTMSQRSENMSEFAIPGTSGNFRNCFLPPPTTDDVNGIGENDQGNNSQLSNRGSMRNFPRSFPATTPSRAGVEPLFGFGEEKSETSNMKIHRVQRNASEYFGNKDLNTVMKKPFDAEKIQVLDQANIGELDPRNLNAPFRSPWINRSQISRGGISGTTDFPEPPTSVSMFSTSDRFRTRIPVKDMMEILSRHGETDDIFQSQMLAPDEEGDGLHYLNPIPDDIVEEMHE